MAAKKTGQTFICEHCGEPFYRRGSHVLRGITKSCGKPECKSAAMSGANNPFWGKTHSPEIRQKIKDGRRAHPPKNPGRKKGYKLSAEERAVRTERFRGLWKNNRDKMMASRATGDGNAMTKLPHERRYRVCFTKVQRREWLSSKCAWCDTTDNLVLDHVIPVMAGGTNIKANAQTLCPDCNLWKMVFVDRPFYFATLGGQGSLLASTRE